MSIKLFLYITFQIANSATIWRKVLKINRGVATSSLPDDWYFTGSPTYGSLATEETSSHISSPTFSWESTNFRSRLINEWKNNNLADVKAVKLGWCNNGNEEEWVIFDTTTTATWNTWLDGQYITSASWSDLKSSASIPSFGIDVTTYWPNWPDRFFGMWNEIIGCATDKAWFFITTATYCSGWNEGDATPQIFYSKATTATTFTGSNEGQAMIMYLQLIVTPSPTPAPTPAPTINPSPAPTINPTPVPTENPTKNPTKHPTQNPTKNPTPAPTRNPTSEPTTSAPTNNPTKAPTSKQTLEPTLIYTNTVTRHSIKETSVAISTTKLIQENKKNTVYMIVVICGAVVLVLVFVIILLVIWIKKLKNKATHPNCNETTEMGMKQHSYVTSNEMKKVVSVSSGVGDECLFTGDYSPSVDNKQNMYNLYNQELPPKIAPVVMTDFGDNREGNKDEDAMKIEYGEGEGWKDENIRNQMNNIHDKVMDEEDPDIVNEINKTYTTNATVTIVDSNVTIGQ